MFLLQARDAARKQGKFSEALEFSTKHEAAASKESRLRLEFGEMQRAESKAAGDRRRVSDAVVGNECPPMAPAAWHGMRDGLFAMAKELADTLSRSASFQRAATLGPKGNIRVSPITMPLADYLLIRRKFCIDLGHCEEKSCRCKLAIGAAAVLSLLEEGDRITLKDLWKRAGGPTSVTGANTMLDQLMYVPVVAFKNSASDAAAAWMVTAKADDVDYLRLGPMMAALQSTGLSAAPRLMSKERLRALQKLASTDADRKLLELSALHGLSRRQATAVVGSNDLGTVAERRAREQQIEEALEVYAAYEDLAKRDALSEISVCWSPCVLIMSARSRGSTDGSAIACCCCRRCSASPSTRPMLRLRCCCCRTAFSETTTL